jgi:argininosuccinate synthase
LIDYLKSKNYVWQDNEKLFSVDINLLHRSCEGGVLENPGNSYDPSKVFGLTQVQAQQEPTGFSLEFKNGEPVSLNGRTMGLRDLLSILNQIGGAHSIGVVDLIEERANGIKSRGIYETPGGTILFHAFKEIKRLCWSRELYFLGQQFAQEYGRLVYDGLWFSDARFAAEGFFKSASMNLSGSVEARIIGSNIIWASRQSPLSLFNASQTSFESDFDELNKASLGFTKFLTASLKHQGRISNAVHNGNS